MYDKDTQKIWLKDKEMDEQRSNLQYLTYYSVLFSDSVLFHDIK